MPDTIRLVGAIAALMLAVTLYVMARGLRCGVCLRPWAIFAGARFEPEGRCWRHRIRRART